MLKKIDVARQLGVRPYQIDCWVQDGLLKGVDGPTGYLRYSQEAIEDLKKKLAKIEKLKEQMGLK